MTISFITLIQSLNKAYRLIKPRREDLDIFKVNFTKLLGHIDEKETEENVKGHLADFLKSTYYDPNHLIATKGRADLVIHLEKEAKSHVGVLFEVKKPSNKLDMVTKNNLNTKAMHELILYFLRERVNHKNISLTHLVITNIYEWFVFDASLFERVFAKSTQLQKAYREWEAGQKISVKTELFYNEIAKPFLHELQEELTFTHVDIREYLKYLQGNKEKDDNKLIPLYKFFSPVNLLKLPFINDSNSLDTGFFKELLHIIGLEEVKDGSRKIIQRLPSEKRQPASLIENTINMLEVDDVLRKVPNKFLNGKTKEEQLFNLGLELSITWVNRILFLKLLEAQLIKYHNGNTRFRFLNVQTVNDYDELHKLFFQVLARQPDKRTSVIQQKYSHIPYLNSSLFEISSLEDVSLRINGLDDNLDIDLYNNSILIKKRSKNQNLTAMNTLHYFFEFLEAYDFASIGKEEVQEENKTIINAAVLGLVFEKMNGYRDGSIYTPGAVTMFLCQETIRKAVVQKFNETYGWKCEDINDVKNYLADKKNRKDILEFNHLIESIRIADPAVGSGHFLVSSLNELIAIKAQLGILADKEGSRLSDIDVSIANDELVITYLNSSFFEYSVTTTISGAHMIAPEVQRIQETLFNEKRKLIEGSLFGVDINPNSVKICQLRLWIELLKHAYYKSDENHTQLETLPNIDINIKHGNSLLNKYSLTEDLSEVFRKQKFGVKDYRLAVEAYKEAPNKEAKASLQNFIKTIKEQFHETVSNRDPRRKRLSELRGQLVLAQNNFDLFGKKRTEKEMEAEVQKIMLSMEKIEKEINDIQNNAIYRNAFEWRFEFPEVLDEKGDFEGFEVIIGNPPYIQLQKMGEDADALQKAGYDTFVRTGDIYSLFYEQAIRLLKPHYYFGYITSNQWMRANYGAATRKLILEQSNPLLLVDCSDYQIFDSATVLTNMLVAQKANYTGETKACSLSKSMGSLEKMSDFIMRSINVVSDFSRENAWTISTPIEAAIKAKIEAMGVPLREWDINIYRGILTGYNEAFIIDSTTRNDLIRQSGSTDLSEIIRPILRGRDIEKYKVNWANLYIIYIPWHFPKQNDKTITGASQSAEEEFRSKYSAVYNYLLLHKNELSQRNKSETGIRYEWYALQRWGANYTEDFSKHKIVYPNMTKFLPFYYDLEGLLINQKCFMITGNNLAFLTAFFNSSLFKYCFKNNFPELQGNTKELSKVFFEKIPVIKITESQSEIFKIKVNEIQSLRKKNIDATYIEIEIDQLIFDLYELSDIERNEIGFVEIL